MKISEIFGPTFQGEGPDTGRTATFLRLGGCNLTCVWCDTAYTWDWTRYDRSTELVDMTPPDVVAALDELPVTELLVVTGGEPLIQQRSLCNVLPHIPHHEVHVETNGTITPTTEFAALVDRFVVSPKLENSEVALDDRIKLDVLATYAATDATVFKFVASTISDLHEIDTIVQTLNVDPWRVWIMPEGTTQQRILDTGRLLFTHIAQRGYNLTLRQQQLLYPKERKR